MQNKHMSLPISFSVNNEILDGKNRFISVSIDVLQDDFEYVSADDYYDMDDDDEDDDDDDFDSFDDDDAPTPKSKKKKKREDDDF